MDPATSIRAIGLGHHRVFAMLTVILGFPKMTAAKLLTVADSVPGTFITTEGMPSDDLNDIKIMCALDGTYMIVREGTPG